VKSFSLRPKIVPQYFFCQKVAKTLYFNSDSRYNSYMMNEKELMMTTTRTEAQEAIDALYNELCSALTAFDYKLRELARLADLNEIENIYLRSLPLHDLLEEIDEVLEK